MADGDGGMFPLQQFGDWSADDAATAQHHDVLAGDGDASTFDQFHATSWRAGNEARQVAHGYAPLVYCVQSEEDEKKLS